MLEAKGVGMVEFSHKSWVLSPPKTYLNGSILADATYKSPEVEVTTICTLPFIHIPGDHRALVVNISTRSIMVEHLYKIDYPIGRRLFTSQPKAVNIYYK